MLLASVQTARSQDLALGEYLSSSCTTCHQLSGKTNGIPAIVGGRKASFAAVMKSYKLGERENQAMRNAAQGLSDEDIDALAAYFAQLKPETNE